MGVSQQDVLHVAALARLSLAPDEVERYTQQLTAILDHVSALETVEAESLGSPAAVEVDAAPVRADARGADALQAPLASIAPAWNDGFFTVPRLAAMETGISHDEEPT
jgi:aspartyl-tRNA(Asn)/glutamyl-tRNA(Gln) amidotransferase subunit C